jgi:hypothetical protein
MKPWIQTYSGIKFHFTEPDPAEININDIAHALSNLCRFTGHVRKYYSVAEHSIYVSQLVPSRLALAGLLHDAAEAYIGDMAKPIKEQMEEFRHLEYFILDTIFQKFDLPSEYLYNDYKEIKNVDYKLCYTEGNQLMPDVSQWIKQVMPYPLTIRCLPPSLAEAEFLQRFYSLKGD